MNIFGGGIRGGSGEFGLGADSLLVAGTLDDDDDDDDGGQVMFA